MKDASREGKDKYEVVSSQSREANFITMLRLPDGTENSKACWVCSGYPAYREIDTVISVD